MGRSGTSNKKLPECNSFHELSFPNLAEEPQVNHSDFINVNETSVMETLKKAPIAYKASLRSHAKLLEEELVVK